MHQGPGQFVISLDFELYWGMRHRADVSAYRPNLIGARRAIPEILKLFGKFQIHATWAVVGFLFCDRTRTLLDCAPSALPNYDDPTLTPYDDLPSDDARDNDTSIFFAPGLIKEIARTPCQEIATHSFSHYYCLEPGQTLATFRDDLQAACKTTFRNYSAPSSLVFPKNQVNTDYLATCAALGITAYRGNLASRLYRRTADHDQTLLRRCGRLIDAYFPLSGNNCVPIPAVAAPGAMPLNVPASRYLRPYWPALKLLEPLRLRRIKRDMQTAAKRRLLFHLWWHPHDFGSHLQQNLDFLVDVLNHFALLRQRYGMESLNMREVCARASAAAA